MIKKITIKESPQNDKEKAKWDIISPKNYEKIIWQSIEDYNYRAQLDIAEIIYQRLLELIKDNKQNTSIAKNLAFRILQLFFEAADQFSLVYMCVIDKINKPVYETYVEGSNAKTRAFFTKCLEGKIKKEDIFRVWGLEKIFINKILDSKIREKTKKITEDLFNKTKKNLKIYGLTYTEYDKKTKKTQYSSSLLGSFGVKHGYKQVIPNELSKSIWKFEDEEPTIIEGLVEITREDNNETKKVIKVGSLFNSKERNINDICKKILEHIAFFSREIQTIASIQLSLIDDPAGSLALFAKNGIIKIGRNDPCLCNSSKKWKKCHGKDL